MVVKLGPPPYGKKMKFRIFVETMFGIFKYEGSNTGADKIS
jgi:hypothetical protein